MNAPIRLLLLKSAQFAHTGKYALYGTPPRWHMVHPNKPAPKGAPVAHAPHAAGRHMPATLQPDQIEALKYPADKAAANKEMAAFNDKHLPDLLAHGANGDATAILGSSYGVNSHGKKKAHVANYLLAAMGSPHKVAPGQGAGEHEAVKAPASTQPSPEPAGEAHAIKASVSVERYGTAGAKGSAGAGVFFAPNGQATSEYGGELNAFEIPVGTKLFKGESSIDFAEKHGLMDAPDPDVKKITGLSTLAQVMDQAGEIDNDKLYDAFQTVAKRELEKAGYQGAHWSDEDDLNPEQYQLWGVKGATGEAKEAAGAVPATALAMPAFHEGKTTTGVVQYYEKVAKKIIDHAEAGNVSVLEGMVDTTKGKTWLGKTENSKLILALHAKALEHAKGGAALATDQKDEALQAAVDHLKEDAEQPGMPAGEAAEDKALVEKLEAAQSGVSVASTKLVKDPDVGTHTVVTFSNGATAKIQHLNSSESLGLPGWHDMDAKAGQSSYLADTKEDAISLLQKKAGAESPKEGDTKPSADGGTLVLKDGRWHKYVNADESGELPPALVPVAEQAKPAANQEPVKNGNPAPAPAPKVVIRQPKPASTLPGDWSGMAVTGLIANKDPVHGGIVDKNSEGWFAIPNMDGVEPLEGFPSQYAAYVALVVAVQTKLKGKVSAGHSGLLAQIPWEATKVPSTNSNAGSHNPMVDKIKGLAEAGDVAGLEAIYAKKSGSKQTYAIKQAKLAQLAIAALKDAPEPAAAAPADKLSQIPWEAMKVAAENSNAKSHNPAVDKIKAMAEAGDTAGLQAIVDAKAGAKQTYAKKQHQLAQLALAALQGDAPEAAPSIAPASAQEAPAEPDAAEQAATLLQSLTEAANKAGYGVFQHPSKGWLAAGPKGNLKTFANLKQAEDVVAKLADAGLLAHVGATHPYLVHIAGKAPEMVVPAQAAPSLSGVGAYHHLSQADNAEGFPGVKAAAEEWVSANPGKEAELSKELYNLGYASLAQVMHLAAPDVAAKPGKIPAPPAPLAGKKAKNFIGAAVASMPNELDENQKQSIKASADKWMSANPGAWDEINEALAVHGLSSLANYGPHAGGFEHGPKNGDTKQGADGMLVFKDGHWHKQDQAAAPEPQAAPVKKLSAGQAIKVMASVAAKTAKGMKGHLKDMAVAGDVAGLQKFIADHPKLPASKMVAQSLINALTGEAGGAPATSVPKSTAAAKPAQPSATPGAAPMDAWTQTGPQAGSNPGGKFKDPSGQEWYCKFPADEDVAKSEVLAAKLYAAMGIAGQDAKLVTKNGKVGIASRWATVSKANASTLAKTDGVVAGFGADAWLGNWDVVGLAFDNLQVGSDGKAVRVDAGGSLQYRAQGGKKAFGNTVIEIDSLRDASINPQAAAVFGKLTDADISASVAKVLSIPDYTITMLVNQFGPGDAANKQALIETLLARKADLAAKYPKAAKAKKAPVFDPSKINEPPNFLNWGGSGKPGPSSKDFLNEANHKAAQAIFEAAKTGDVGAVKGLEAPTFDKNTGAVIGHKSVVEHPSQHIKGYAQQVINEINFQMNPPKQFRFDGGHPLHSLNASYPPFTGQLQADAVSKVGKFITLGDPGVLSVESLGLPKITHKAGLLTASTYAAAAQAAIAKMPETQRQAVQAYTGSSYHTMNSSLWAGNPVGKAKAAAEALHTLGHDIAPGTVLSRKISVHGDDLHQILGSTGKVLQEPAIMSTSIRPSSWSGNVHLKLHVGPGVKGLWVGHGSKPGGGALSVNSGEDELVLPPNTRILILSVKKGGGDEDGFGVGIPHIIEAVVLPSEGY